jgi:hypothetical protein
MSETKVPASNLVSKESLERKQQWLRDNSIHVPTLASIIQEREAKKESR